MLSRGVSWGRLGSGWSIPYFVKPGEFDGKYPVGTRDRRRLEQAVEQEYRWGQKHAGGELWRVTLMCVLRVSCCVWGVGQGDSGNTVLPRARTTSATVSVGAGAESPGSVHAVL